MLLSSQVQQEIQQIWDALAKPVEIRFYPGRGGPAADTMRDLWRELAGLNGHLQLKEMAGQAPTFAPEDPDDIEGPIAELWMDEQFTGMRYLGIPSGHEFGALVDTIRAVSVEVPPELSDETRLWLITLDRNLHLEVFVTPTCPYCPRAVRLAQEMARVNPSHVVADMVDASTFSRLSNKFNVMGVPMTVVNGSKSVTGAVPESRLISTIREALGA